MAIHWSDYPERVESVGDLMSVLETLDRHDDEHGFSGDWFDKESDTSAYTVDLTPTSQHLRPRPDRMPGLDRLLDRLEREGQYELTLNALRGLRGRAATATNGNRTTVNAMTFDQLADALDAAERPPATPPVPPSPAPVGGSMTFGDFLADVRSVEAAAASIRAEADAMNNAPGTGHFRLQAGLWEAQAAYRSHPSFPQLEAHVNRLYGPLTYSNLLRVRGEVCAARNCGSTDADRLSVEQVVTALGCPGAPAADPPPGRTAAMTVDTRPESEEPPSPLLDAAVRGLPGVLNEAPAPQGMFDPARRRGSDYAVLRQQMEAAGHSRAAAEWAIHRHVEAGRLEAAPGLTGVPGFFGGDGTAPEPMQNYTRERARCILWAAPALWEWWRANTATPAAAPYAGAEGSTNPGSVTPPPVPVFATPKSSNQREWGRPKLGEGRKATPEQKALRNVYDLIRAAMTEGAGAKTLLRRFRNNKDFLKQVDAAGKTFNEALFKSALCWIKANTSQETRSGKVS